MSPATSKERQETGPSRSRGRMKNHALPISQRLLLFTAILEICAIVVTGTPATAETIPRIQELHGLIEDDRGLVYTLKELKKGDAVYAYMTNTGGNLDPLLGVFRKESPPEFQYENVLTSVVNSDRNFIEAFSIFADDKFIVWDDDSGAGYDASLTFTVPADGDYVVFAGSMITNLTLGMFEPTFTFGSYRLLFGINAPVVGDGKGEPTGKAIATIDSRNIKPSSATTFRQVGTDSPFLLMAAVWGTCQKRERICLLQASMPRRY